MRANAWATNKTRGGSRWAAQDEHPSLQQSCRRARVLHDAQGRGRPHTCRVGVNGPEPGAPDRGTRHGMRRAPRRCSLPPVPGLPEWGILLLMTAHAAQGTPRAAVGRKQTPARMRAREEDPAHLRPSTSRPFQLAPPRRVGALQFFPAKAAGSFSDGWTTEGDAASAAADVVGLAHVPSRLPPGQCS